MRSSFVVSGASPVWRTVDQIAWSVVKGATVGSVAALWIACAILLALAVGRLLGFA